jgi:hypothetical protein
MATESALPWFPMHAAELLADENFTVWSLEERGAWLTLIARCWLEGTIPSDLTSLAKLLRCDGGAMRLLWSGIGSRFIEAPGQPGRLISPRVERERDRARSLIRQKVEAGKKGAKARWHGDNSAMAPPSTTGGAATVLPMANDGHYPTVPNPTEPDTTQPASQSANGSEDPWLAGFRGKLAERLHLPETVSIGKDRAAVLAFFQQQIAAVGEDVLLNDCEAVARKSETGVPSSLSWFVGWLQRFPVPVAEARS